MPSRVRSILAAFGLACAAACGGGGGGTPPPPPASQIAKFSGDSQVAEASTQVQLQVIVKDTGGSAVPDVPIAWAAQGGGSVSAASSNSDALGVATVMRTLPANAATVTTTATKAGLSGSPVTFTSVAQVNGAYRIEKFANDSQTDTVLATLGAPFRVHVTDWQSNNVTGYTVSWSAATGGGSVGAPTSTTDGSGIAQITRTLGSTAGTQTTHASVTGLIGSPITFTAIANPGHAAALALNSQSAAVGAPNANLTFSVKSTDAHGNLVNGVIVDWAAVAGGGSVSKAEDTTKSGLSTITHTLGSSPGKDTVTATANPSLSGSPVTFATTITSAPASATDSVLNDLFKPDTITIASGGTITWKWNSGGIGHNVTFENTGVLGTGSVTQSGTATFVKTLTGVAPGTYRFECTIHGSGYTTGMVGVIIVQ